MAIDMVKLSYHIYLLRETGETLDISEIVTNAGWEENKGELASRMSLTVANVPYNGTYMSSIAKPNCYILVYAELGGISEEVARCKITDWETAQAEEEDSLLLSGYDELYDLQKSEDQRFVADGTSTKQALLAIFSDWGIPLGNYDGPAAACANTPYSDPLSDIILDLLDNAHKHGDPECHIRANKGKVDVIRTGSNAAVYCFEEGKNLSTARMKISTADMITVVKVLSADEDDAGKRAVETVVEGRTEYGRRQKILVRDADDDLATATASANQILKDEGEPEQTLKVKTPDIPFVRKYDRVQIASRTYTGGAVVVSVQHDIDARSMTMELEPIGDPVEAKAVEEKKNVTFQKGDIVTFAGGYHYYTSRDTNPRGGWRTGGQAWVQNVAPKAPHPYALIGGAYKTDVPGSSNVYGWVDADTVS